MNQIISTPAAPAAIGPYSQAIQAGGLLFLSGTMPIDPAYRRIGRAADRRTGRAGDEEHRRCAAGCRLHL